MERSKYKKVKKVTERYLRYMDLEYYLSIGCEVVDDKIILIGVTKC